MSFVDQEKLQKLTERVENALRDLGLTMIPQATGFSVQGEEMIFQTAAIVRDSAGMEQDQDSREEFQQMMAENAKQKLEEEKNKIAKAFDSPEALQAFLLGDEENDCEHNWHPDGFCTLCLEGME